MKITKENTLLIKGVAIILMFTHHLFRFPSRVENVKYFSLSGDIFNGYNIEYLIGDFGKICVGIFLFLSGIGLYYSGKHEWKDSKKRIINFYSYFIFIFIIFIPIGYFMIKGNIVKGEAMYSGGLKELVLNLSLLKTTYCGEWWFAGLYVQLLILSPLIFKLLKNNKKKSIIVHLSIYFLYFGLLLLVKYLSLESIKKNILYQNLLIILIYQIIFYFGIITANFELYKKLDKVKLEPKLGLVFVFIGRIIASIYKVSDIIDVIFVFFFIYFFIKVMRYKYKRVRKLLMILGENSTNMWLVHSLYCYYYFQNFIFLPKISILILAWLIIISLVTSIVIKKLYARLNYNLKKIL